MPRKPIVPPDDFVPPSGLCECGCGATTPVSRNSKPERGEYFGFHLRFVHGHNSVGTHPVRPSGRESARWKGGNPQTNDGYRLVYAPGHPLADKRHYALEHRLVWHNAHGAIPHRHHIHHIDGNRQNNALSNLVCIAPSDHGKHHGSRQSAEKRRRISESLKRAWKTKRAHRPR